MSSVCRKYYTGNQPTEIDIKNINPLVPKDAYTVSRGAEFNSMTMQNMSAIYGHSHTALLL